MTGAVVWFTGLPASGKTTLAAAVQRKLGDASIPACLFDSDQIRSALVPSPGYSLAERDAFYAALARLAALLAEQGLVVLVAATAHRNAHRRQARELAPRFIEVFVQTPLEECERRDPKGLYARARNGDLPHLPGARTEYETPTNPDVIAPNGCSDEAVSEVVRLVEAASLGRTNPSAAALNQPSGL